MIIPSIYDGIAVPRITIPTLYIPPVLVIFGNNHFLLLSKPLLNIILPLLLRCPHKVANYLIGTTTVFKDTLASLTLTARARLLLLVLLATLVILYAFRTAVIIATLLTLEEVTDASRCAAVITRSINPTI